MVADKERQTLLCYGKAKDVELDPDGLNDELVDLIQNTYLIKNDGSR